MLFNLGCICWIQSALEDNANIHVSAYISTFPASVLADNCIPEVDDDDTPLRQTNKEDSFSVENSVCSKFVYVKLSICLINKEKDLFHLVFLRFFCTFVIHVSLL